MKEAKQEGTLEVDLTCACSMEGTCSEVMPSITFSPSEHGIASRDHNHVPSRGLQKTVLTLRLSRRRTGIDSVCRLVLVCRRALMSTFFLH